MQALTAATKSTADIFRLNDRGRIAPGRRADLVLVRGDPTRDITVTRDILRVWRSGVEFQRGIPARVAHGRVDKRDWLFETLTTAIPPGGLPPSSHLAEQLLLVGINLHDRRTPHRLRSATCA
jgi:hypothetical protein